MLEPLSLGVTLDPSRKVRERVEILRARSHGATRFAGVKSGLPCRWVDSNLYVHRVPYQPGRGGGLGALVWTCSFATCWTFVGRPRRVGRLQGFDGSSAHCRSINAATSIRRKARFRPTLNDGTGYVPALRRLRMVWGASLVISATCTTDRAGGYSDDRYASEVPAWLAADRGLERCMDVRLLQSPHRLPYGSGGKRKRTYSSTVPPRPGVCTDVAVCSAVCSFRSCSYPLREASARASVHRVGTRHRSVDFSMVFLAGFSSFRRGLPRRQNGLKEASVFCRWLCPETSTGVISGLTVCLCSPRKSWPSSDK